MQRPFLPSPVAGHHSHMAGVLARVAAMMSLAAVYGLVKWCGERGVPLLEIVFFRNVVAFVPILFYIRRTTGFGALRTRNPRGHLLRAAVGMVGMLGGFAALQFLPLTEAAALGFAAPLFTTIAAALILREPTGWHRWGAVLVGLVGVVIMLRPDPSHMNLVGAAFALAGALGAAGATTTVRQMSRTEPAQAITFYFTVTGAAVGLAGLPFGWVVPDLPTLAALLALGLVGGLTQILATESLRMAPAGLVVPFDYSQLVWAAVIGFLVWGETPRPVTLAGALVVAASGAYIIHRETRLARRPPPPTSIA